MFVPLMSRWRIPAACASASADAIWIAEVDRLRGGQRTGVEEVVERASLDELHHDEVAAVASSTKSWIVQMLGWFRAEAAVASSRNRSRRSASRAKFSGRSLTATIRPRRVSRAR